MVAVCCAGAGVPTIVETDIGQYMDDTWALATLFAAPETDVQVVVVSTNDTEARARIVGKLLAGTEYDLANVTLVVNERESEYAGPQAGWAADYDLGAFPGRVVRARTNSDAVAAVAAHLRRVAAGGAVLVSLAPPVVLGELLGGGGAAAGARLAVSAMGGSVYYGYGHAPGAAREYNVARNASHAHRLLAARGGGVPLYLAPLDTSSQVRFEGARWERLLAASAASPLLGNVLESYRWWKAACPSDPYGLMCFTADPARNGGNMFDAMAAAVAAQLARSDGGARSPVLASISYTPMRLAVNASGYTVPDTAAHSSEDQVALSWNDHEGFLDRLLSIIIKQYN